MNFDDAPADLLPPLLPGLLLVDAEQACVTPVGWLTARRDAANRRMRVAACQLVVDTTTFNEWTSPAGYLQRQPFPRRFPSRIGRIARRISAQAPEARVPTSQSYLFALPPS